jgi:hypothetical protein
LAEPAAFISHPCFPGRYYPEVGERVTHTFFVCKLT